MTSPDLTPYVDLTLFDRSAEDIFDVWLTDVQSKIPDYQPVETNTEVVVAEGLALEVAEEVFAINRLPSSTIEGVLRLFSVSRDEGAPPTAQLRFALADTAGHTIPAGTRIALQLTSGLDPVVFSTDVELVVPAGSATGDVAATGDRFTSEANGYAAGTLVDLLDAVSFAETVTLAAQPVGGRDAEDQQAWLTRGVARFARLSETVGLRRQFEEFALEFGVFRAFAVDMFDPTAPVVPQAEGPGNIGLGGPGTNPGHVTVAVYGRGDTPIPAATKAELLAALQPVSVPHLIKHVVDPSVTPIDVTVTLARRSGFSSEAVNAAAELALRDYLSPDRWPWDRLVRRTQLITLLAAVPGVAYVAALTSPAADVSLPGFATLTRPGALSVIVAPEGTV